MTTGQDKMASFARDHVAPRDLLHADSFPFDLWKAMAAEGLFRIGVAEGGYAAIAAAGAILAEIGRAPGFAFAWTGRQLVGRFMIGGFGNAKQHAVWMPGLANGSLTACVAISEAGVGAHPKKLSTTAVSTDNQVVLNGSKSWVSNAPLADLVIVFAISRTEGHRKDYSAYVVPCNAPGLTLVDGGELGALRPSQHCGLRFDACSIPVESRLGAPDAAFERMAIPFRDVEDTVGASVMAGTFRHLLHRLASATDPGRQVEAATSLGALAASTALAAEAAASLAAGLDAGTWHGGSPPERLTGIRLLCEEILAGMQRYRSVFAPGPDGAIEVLFGDLALLLNVAKGPRLVKQGRIGMALLRQAPAQQEWGA